MGSASRFQYLPHMQAYIFFPEQKDVDFPPEIEARVKLWDKAYAHVGTALSETEWSLTKKNQTHRLQSALLLG